MPDTILGGAYLAADGKTWHNANGEPLTEDQVHAAKRLHTRRANDLAARESERVNQAVRNDPIAQALLTQAAAQMPVAQLPHPTQTSEPPPDPQGGKGKKSE